MLTFHNIINSSLPKTLVIAFKIDRLNEIISQRLKEISNVFCSPVMSQFTTL